MDKTESATTVGLGRKRRTRGGLLGYLEIVVQVVQAGREGLALHNNDVRRLRYRTGLFAPQKKQTLVDSTHRGVTDF